MRYVIAMGGAFVAAVVATLFISPLVANLVVDRFTYDSPDSVADLHAGVFMGCNLLALLVGWAIAWVIGGRFVRAPTV